MSDQDADYVAAEADIVAYWESLDCAENPNGVWYLERGDVHNLMDAATEEITELRALALYLMETDPAQRDNDPEESTKRALQVAKIYQQREKK